MSESFIPASEFETASNAVSNILGQPVEEIKITDILPPLNDAPEPQREKRRRRDGGFHLRPRLYLQLPR